MSFNAGTVDPFRPLPPEQQSLPQMPIISPVVPEVPDPLPPDWPVAVIDGAAVPGLPREALDWTQWAKLLRYGVKVSDLFEVLGNIQDEEEYEEGEERPSYADTQRTYEEASRALAATMRGICRLGLPRSAARERWLHDPTAVSNIVAFGQAYMAFAQRQRPLPRSSGASTRSNSPTSSPAASASMAATPATGSASPVGSPNGSLG